MNTLNQNHIIISPQEKIREYYRVNKTLFGLFSWKEIVRQDLIGNELVIKTERPLDKVVVNGVEYVPNQNTKGE